MRLPAEHRVRLRTTNPNPPGRHVGRNFRVSTAKTLAKLSVVSDTAGKKSVHASATPTITKSRLHGYSRSAGTAASLHC